MDASFAAHAVDVATHGALPPLMRLASGRYVASVQDWQKRRLELLDLATRHVYGALPDCLGPAEGLLLHEALNRSMRGGKIQSWRVLADGKTALHLQLLLPPGDGACGVLISGDACWGYAGDAVRRAVLQRGYALALFNRTEIMADLAGAAQQQARCDALQGFGGASIAAWAWGYHCAVDMLLRHPRIRPDALAVVGHSRGGKAALLAGASDTRIMLTSANNSGAGGGGCWRILGPGAETLGDITHAYPAWFSPELARYADSVEKLPFDQHMLKALIAPRHLLTTEAQGDAWANPPGSRHTHEAAKQAYRFLGAEHHLALIERPGSHAQTFADWATVLAGMDQVFGAVDAHAQTVINSRQADASPLLKPGPVRHPQSGSGP